MTKLCAITVLSAACAFGHHSLQGTYFLDQQVTISGKVTQFLLQNPHSYLEVEAPDATGVLQEWTIEWRPAGVLLSTGVQRNTVMPGDEVTITMSPGRVAGDHRGVLRIIRRPSDGFEWGTKPGEEPQEWGPARK
jgi:hypothetical protein